MYISSKFAYQLSFNWHLNLSTVRATQYWNSQGGKPTLAITSEFSLKMKPICSVKNTDLIKLNK
jgi:hypothetical protein